MRPLVRRVGLVGPTAVRRICATPSCPNLEGFINLKTGLYARVTDLGGRLHLSIPGAPVSLRRGFVHSGAIRLPARRPRPMTRCSTASVEPGGLIAHANGRNGATSPALVGRRPKIDRFRSFDNVPRISQKGVKTRSPGQDRATGIGFDCVEKVDEQK